MTRDYKHRARGRREKRPSAPPWLWGAAGLALGLLVAGLVWLRAQAPDDKRPAQPVPKTVEPRASTPEPAPERAPPRFDFYHILPELEVAVPEHEITGKVREGVRQVEKPGVYLLQAGSFRTFEQADRLKAELALLGLEAAIQTITINDREQWHRVRVGPYADLATLNQARIRLKENGIDALLLRVKE